MRAIHLRVDSIDVGEVVTKVDTPVDPSCGSKEISPLKKEIERVSIWYLDFLD